MAGRWVERLAGEWVGGQAGRKECRQAGFYIASFKPAEGQLQKLVNVNMGLKRSV